jgi:predicted DNA-binding protein
MARDDPHFRLRLPADLKTRIEDTAKESGRSVNAEIVQRLDASFQPQPGFDDLVKSFNETLDGLKTDRHEMEAFYRNMTAGLLDLAGERVPEHMRRLLKPLSRNTGEPDIFTALYKSAAAMTPEEVEKVWADAAAAEAASEEPEHDR